MIRKYIISTLIILYLWQAISVNLASIQFLAPWWRHVIRLPILSQIDRWTSLVASQLTLRFAWSPFTNPEAFYYTLQLTVHYEDQPDQIVLMPQQQQRTWWQRNFVDTHEDKFLVNLYYRKVAARKWYALYWCRQLKKSNLHPRAIAANLTFYSSAPNTPPKIIPWGTFSCL